jgi:RNA polymerase sigma-70 factor (ECF subfamily)
MTCPTDGQLLRAFQNGDTSAFSALVELHQATLLKHARAILGPGSPYEDVVQEVFLKLAQSPPTLPPEAAGDDQQERAALLRWLHTVTRNCCMDFIRSEARRKRREHDVAGYDVAEGGLATVDERDTRQAVERELAKLPVDQREVLVLRLLGDRSYKEIAEITGKKIGTVGWLVSVGLKTLSQELAPLLHGAGERVRGERSGPPANLDLVQGELS